MSATSVEKYLKQQQRDYILSSFYTFCMLSGAIAPIFEQPHKEMCDELQACEPDFSSKLQKKELYLAPRGTYKTSLVAAFIVYLFLKYPNIRIAMGRATHALAKGILSKIKEMLKYPMIRDVFGDLSKGATKWSEEQITINTRTKAFQEPTVDTYGLGTSLTGQHYDVIFGDDFVTEENYTSAAAFDDAQITLQSFNAVLNPGGSQIITGTRWPGDIYGWIIETDDKLYDAAINAGLPEDQAQAKRQWRQYIRGAWDSQGQLFFPERLSEEFLEQQRASNTLRLFTSWYLNQVHEEGLKIFPHIPEFTGNYYANPSPVLAVERQHDVLMVPVYVTMTIDPALMSNPRNDEMGVVINGTDYDENWWILHAEGFRKVPSQQASTCLYLIRHYLPRVVCVESAGADAEFMDRLSLGIKDINDRQGPDRQISLVGYAALRDELPGLRGKGQRIESLEPRAREGRIKLAKRTTSQLYRQMDGWPNLPNHDDVIDALAMQRHVAKKCALKTAVGAFDVLEADEEKMSWGPNGKPAQAAALVLGRAIAQVGRGTQRLPL
jgi:hypothetical protein